MNRPHILYIHSHDTGRYVRPFGHAVDTPNLQRLAEEGVLFRQNFCVNPTCSPSRASLLTGCYPHENGMTGLAHRGWALNDYGQHLIHTLKGVGYTAVLTGVQHVAVSTNNAKAWQTIGYDRYLAGEAHLEAAAFLREAHDAPFFLSVGFFETHREFPSVDQRPMTDDQSAAAEDDQWRGGGRSEEGAVENPNYCLPPAPLPDTPETRLDMARYKASVKILDRKIGVVLQALEASGLAENTLVICTTDHGIAFPRMKCHLQDSGIGTMLILRGGMQFGGGMVVDAMTSHLDIFPTICELLQIESPDWLRGKSVLPLVDGTVDQLHEALFFELNYHAAYEPMRAVRTRRWKYIRRFDGRETAVLPNCDDGESKSILLENGLETQPLAEEMLFDLLFDPNETNNLAGASRFEPILTEMKTRLQQWMVETADPLLNGRVPAPAGAVVNDVNGRSPKEKTHPA